MTAYEEGEAIKRGPNVVSGRSISAHERVVDSLKRFGSEPGDWPTNGGQFLWLHP